MSNELKINNATLEGGLNTGASAPNPPVIDENKPENTPEPTADKHHGTNVITYIGNGVWTDSKGKKWHKGENSDGRIGSCKMTDAELENRPDIKFMISYGAMKRVSV